MKRNVLARRAASAALAACMMFSLSAPALAASTDALLQQSTAAKSAVSVLDEENGMQVDESVQDFDIIINGQSVNSENYNNILGNGTLYYDIEEKTLKLKDGKSFEGALTITAPEDVSIDLEADASHVVNGDLTVNGAKDVKVTKLGGGAAAAIEGKAEIRCSGDVILQNWGGDTHDGRNLTKYGLTVQANTVTTEGGINGEAIIDCTRDIVLGNEWGTTVSKLTVKNADNVTVTSGSVYRSIEDDVDITCSGTVEIKGKKPINVKVIFTQAGNKPYVYFTDESSEEYKDSRITPIPETIGRKYLRIEPRETYSITVKNGTAQVVGDTDGKLTTAFAGEKVTVSGENKNPSVTKFGGWKVISPEGFELTEEQKNA